jgi:NADPH:quinone reductase-like Zn-dependent oxidoreductase
LFGTTGYQALGKAGVHSGDSNKVLILGGSSAVGHLAIQIAKKVGCWVATTCSSRTKEYVESIGAAALIIDDTKEKGEEIKGIDASIFDTVGEQEALERAKPILRSDGYFVTIVAHDVGFDPSAHAPLKHAASMVLSNDTEVQDELMSMMAAGELKVSVKNDILFDNRGSFGND